MENEMAPASPPASPAPRGEEGDPSPGTARDAKTRLKDPLVRDGLYQEWLERVDWEHDDSIESAFLGGLDAALKAARSDAPEAKPEGPSPSSSPTPAPQGAEAAKWLEADLAEVNDRSRNQPSNCRECGGPRNWNGSKPPFCPRCLVSDWPIVEGHVFDYPAAARSIALNLAEFFHTEEPYPLAIANAARRARTQVKTLRAKVETLEAGMRVYREEIRYQTDRAEKAETALRRAAPPERSEGVPTPNPPAPASPCSHPNGTKYEHSVHGERICPDCLEIYPATKPAEITGQTLAQATGQLQSVIDAAFGAAPASPGGLDLEAVYRAGYSTGFLSGWNRDGADQDEAVKAFLAAAPPPRSLEARPLDVEAVARCLERAFHRFTASGDHQAAEDCNVMWMHLKAAARPLEEGKGGDRGR